MPVAARVIAVANQKGGVGKSTSAANIAVSLAQHGLDVLTIDWDSQIGLTDCLGLGDESDHPTILDCLGEDPRPVSEVRQVTPYPGLHHVRSHIDLAREEFRLTQNWDDVRAFERLLDIVDPIRDTYDAVIIDCPPSFSALTIMALHAADSVLIPVQCNFHSFRGVDRSLSIITELLERFDLEPMVLRTMVRTNTRVNRVAGEQLIAAFGNSVLPMVVKLTTGFDEAVLARFPYLIYDPLSEASAAYRAVAREVAVRSGLVARRSDRTPHAISPVVTTAIDSVREETVWVVPANPPAVDEPTLGRLADFAFAAGGHYSAWVDPAGYTFPDEAKAEDFVDRVRANGMIASVPRATNG